MMKKKELIIEFGMWLADFDDDEDFECERWSLCFDANVKDP